MLKFFFLLIFLIVPNNELCAQLLYPVVGEYKNKSAQDMAIYKDRAYLMSDGGLYRVFNLKTGEVEGDGYLASSGNNTHINCACFGAEIPDSSDIPFLYVSETKSPFRCFVENINGGNAVLVQTIEAVENGAVYSNYDWIVDKDNCCLYGLKCYWNQYVDEKGNIRTAITKYRLPKVNEGKKVVLSEKDIIDRYDVLFSSSMQGAIIHKGKLYIATGLWESDKNTLQTSRIIVVVDVKKKRKVKEIDVNLLTTNEPEGLDFYRNKCLLFCGGTGGIYKVK